MSTLPTARSAAGAGSRAGRTPLFLPPTLALLHFLRWGYVYGSGDHDEVLPQVLHRLDPALFARDWFVLSQADGVTVRTVFVEGLAALSRAMPLSFAVGLVHFTVLVAVAWGVYRLAYALVPNALGAALGSFLAVVLLPHWTLGANRLTYSILAPENIAWALALPAVVGFLRGRRVVPGILVGLAAWVQLLVGVQTAAVLGLVALWAAASGRSAREVKGAVLFGIVAGVVAAPIALPAVLAAPLGGPTLPEVSSFHALARLRVPHHYLPSVFPLSDYLRLGLLVIGGSAALTALRRSARMAAPQASFAGRFLVVVGVLLLGAAVAIEGGEVLFVAKLQLFKLTVWAATFCSVLVGAWGMGVLPARAQSLSERLIAWRPMLLVVLAAALGVGALVAAGVQPFAGRYVSTMRDASDLGRAEAWVARETPRDALFLIPPTNTTFRTRARRSVVVNFKPTPYQRGGIDVWLARTTAVAPAPIPEDGDGFKEALDAAYAAQSPTDWQRLAARFGADWALVDLGSTASPPPSTPAFRAGDWGVYRLQPQPTD